MAVAYTRLRMFWGALDITAAQQETPGYTSGQIVTGGTSAAIGSGVGVRRATLSLDRSVQNSLLDPAICHFDFLNLTGGNPDDTWIAADFTTLETAIKNWMTATAGYMPTSHKWTNIIWHRVGTGIPKPNPAERNLLLAPAVAGTGGTSDWPSQVALSITFKTGVRKSWGRTYFPWTGATLPTGYAPAATVDALATATHNLVTAAATGDFYLVVVSAPRSSAL